MVREKTGKSGGDVPRNRRGAKTREQLILAAEKLFATRGLDAVPLLEIVRAAGQRNNASIRYYFKDRAGLLEAIFLYRSSQYEAERRIMLDAVIRDGRQQDVKSLLRVIVGPEMRSYIQGTAPYFLKLSVDYMVHLRPSGVLHPGDKHLTPTQATSETLELLERRFSFLGRQRFYFRYEAVVTMMLGAFVNITPQAPIEREDIGILAEDMLDMMTAALCAVPWTANP